jgi:hypothetical protein
MSTAVRLRAWESSASYPKGPLRDANGDEPSALTITSLSPSTGTTAGGTSTTITGTNLYGMESMTLGGTAVTSWTWNSSTSVTFTTPANTAGAKSLVITQKNGTATTKSSAFTYS